MVAMRAWSDQVAGRREGGKVVIVRMGPGAGVVVGSGIEGDCRSLGNSF